VSLFSSDTRPEVAQILIEGYRRMTPTQKIARVFDLSLAARQLAAARIRQQYLGISDREMQLRVAALALGRDIMVRVFGWDPDKEGW
jgi:hypothetical protein